MTAVAAIVFSAYWLFLIWLSKTFVHSCFNSGANGVGEDLLNLLKAIALLSLPSAVVWQIRKVLIEYVGDVAIYASAHRLSQHWRTRSSIRNQAHALARAVLSERENGAAVYQHVVFVGHSLGSVVSYDVLNQLLIEDEAEGELDVAGRTKLLMTMGSPLDKLAYIFRSQLQGAPFREALMAAQEPLISCYSHRTMRWVNIYSRKDIVASRLQYYDAPSADPVKDPVVENVCEEDGGESIRRWNAHTGYWHRATFGRCLYEGIWGVPPSAKRSAARAAAAV